MRKVKIYQNFLTKAITLLTKVNIILKLELNEGGVLVHCAAGVSRVTNYNNFSLQL